VHDPLVGDRIDPALRLLKLRLGGLLVASRDRLPHVLDGGTQFGALTGIMGAALLRLARTFLG